MRQIPNHDYCDHCDTDASVSDDGTCYCGAIVITRPEQRIALVAAGRAEERAAIAAWLRSAAADQRRAWGDGSEVASGWDDTADEIEEGEHVKADGESK